jgi:hypothetical protein
MNKFFIIAAILACANAGGVARDYVDLKIGQECFNPFNAYTITEFDLTPFPPVKDKDFVIKSVGTFNEAETIIGATLNIYLNARKLYTETFPQNGTFYGGETGTFTVKQKIPFFVPDSNYKIDFSLVNAVNQNINCWEVEFKL